MSPSQRVMTPVVRTNNGPLVFVVQNPHRWSPEDKAFVPKHDVESARVFGDLVEVLSPTASPFNFDTIREELHFKMKHYREGDHVVLVGNPALIGAVTALAARYNRGDVRVLQWSGKDQRYMPILMDDLAVDYCPLCGA